MKHDSHHLMYCLLLIVLCWMITSSEVVAQPIIEEQQRLDFGTLAVAANTTVSRFTFPRNGTNISIEGQFVSVDAGTPGRYRFTGFPAFTPLEISLSSAALTVENIGVSEPLNVDNYDFTDITTNAQGEAELSLGARLNTTGNGATYADSPYSGTALLSVNYWQPLANSFVNNTKIIQLAAELRSTLTISEEQQLHFGTLFARSSSTDQAALTLSPTGSYAISAPGNSRLVSLSTPDQGILKVSGAAPNYSLTITPQAGDVLLEHSEVPGSAPHFILSSLLSSPASTGISDSNGEMLISIGGTLKTELTASTEIYPSGQYEGTYQLTVSY